MSNRRENQALMDKLRPGDIVKFRRDAMYCHFALYIGNGRVIHLTSSNPATFNSSSKGALSAAGLPVDIGNVSEDDFFEVAADSKAELANWDEKSPYSEAEIVKRAKAKIGPAKYSIETYNCEHFVNEIKYGKPVSKQVDSAKQVGKFAAFTAAVSASLYLVNNQKGKGKEKEASNK
ncbi:phospholipase A and acyltransferase 3-like [Physella acuta]|uniref:phospholipase A and acyltransferase 3-like n=1 Tax=Physella acuta TaxID=109671 RepID=UPI0027DAC8C5|nr:phospholipase A and acyltransferase 3-like [Physella acuta]